MGFPVNVSKPVLCKAKRKHKHTQPWLISVNFKNSNICIHIHIFLCRISLFFSSSTFHGTSRSYGCVYPFSVIWPFDPCTRSSCTNACLGEAQSRFSRIGAYSRRFPRIDLDSRGGPTPILENRSLFSKIPRNRPRFSGGSSPDSRESEPILEDSHE